MAKGYHHVTQEIRSQIQVLKASGCSLRSIATQVGLHASTISREIKRNSGQRGYRYQQAESKAIERRHAASKRPHKLTAELVGMIQEKIRMDWSPEQISGWLKRQGTLISHESIYRMIWADKKAGGKLYQHLRHHGKRYNKRSSGKAGRGCIPGRVDISERPKIVELKSRYGDWEVDTMSGGNHQGNLFTGVDRYSKFTILKKIGTKHAAHVVEAMKERMSALLHPVLTVTFDNGKEFARHEEIAFALDALCFFAKPYRAWERGLNEHTNGLVRQYLPKSSDLNKVSDEFVAYIEDRINNRPRKVLGYQSPFEVWSGGLQS